MAEGTNISDADVRLVSRYLTTEEKDGFNGDGNGVDMVYRICFGRRGRKWRTNGIDPLT